LIGFYLLRLVEFKTNTVYELRYFYQSEMDSALHADVVMTGTGPMYRFFWNIPSKEWTEVRRLFTTPDRILLSEGKIFLLQNRSMVPIRYANVSLREVDMPLSEVSRHAPSMSVHSITADDQLILPGSRKATADFLIDTDGENLRGWFARFDKLPATLFFYTDEMMGYDGAAGVRALPSGGVDIRRGMRHREIL